MSKKYTFRSLVEDIYFGGIIVGSLIHSYNMYNYVQLCQ